MESLRNGCFSTAGVCFRLSSQRRVRSATIWELPARWHLTGSQATSSDRRADPNALGHKSGAGRHRGVVRETQGSGEEALTSISHARVWWGAEERVSVRAPTPHTRGMPYWMGLQHSERNSLTLGSMTTKYRRHPGKTGAAAPPSTHDNRECSPSQETCEWRFSLMEAFLWLRPLQIERPTILPLETCDGTGVHNWGPACPPVFHRAAGWWLRHMH